MSAIRYLALLLLLGVSLACRAAPPTTSVERLDLGKFSGAGLPPSLVVTLYRSAGTADRRPLVILVPAFGTQLRDDWFRKQAEYFTEAGYVVAVPHFDGLYNDGVHLPVYDTWNSDLAGATTPYALQVLATVAMLTRPDGPAAPEHVVLGQEVGGLIAARYAALNPPGCKGLILISAGIGVHGLGLREDMRRSEDAFKALGQHVKIPSLWLFAEPNQRIPEATAKDLFSAYQSGGAPGTLEMLPRLGMNGDALFSNPDAPEIWQLPVSKFLASIGVASTLR